MLTFLNYNLDSDNTIIFVSVMYIMFDGAGFYLASLSAHSSSTFYTLFFINTFEFFFG